MNSDVLHQHRHLLALTQITLAVTHTDRQTDRHTSGSDEVTGPTQAQIIGSRVLNIAEFCIADNTDISDTHADNVHNQL